MLEYPSFAVFDLASVMLIIALIVYPRLSGKGYSKRSLPFYVLLLYVIRAFIAVMLGYVATYITVSWPSQPFISNYINSTMYPVLGKYDSNAVITFTQNVVGSHSHAMVPILMASIVVLIAIVCRHDT